MSVADIREQCNVAGSLNRVCKLALVLCAGARNSSGKNFGALAYKLTQPRYIFIIDVVNLVDAEGTYLPSSARTVGARIVVSIHVYYLLVKNGVIISL